MARRRRRRRKGRPTGPRRRIMLCLGVAMLCVAAALAIADAFERTGLVTKWFGVNAVRGFGSRTLDTLTAAPLLIALLAIGGTLIAAAVLSRK